MALDEFDIIATYFNKSTRRNDVVLGVGDDCAILNCSSKETLLASTDTLNLNRHFFPDTPPFDVGYKAVAVSLSDIAAMGGQPAWMLLSITLPEVDDDWLRDFSTGFFHCLETYNLALVGGNTTRGPLAITTQILGYIDGSLPPLSRARAQPGDDIFVTNTLGDAGLSLAYLKGDITPGGLSTEEVTWLRHRLFRPVPRVKEGQLLRPIAHAAIDISDGLLVDLEHILTASNVGASIYLDRLPFSPLFDRFPTAFKHELALSSGDDYELCFTLPSHLSDQLQDIAKQTDCQFTLIGKIEEQSGLRVLNKAGEEIILKRHGYKHFE